MHQMALFGIQPELDIAGYHIRYPPEPDSALVYIPLPIFLNYFCRKVYNHMSCL